MLFFALAGALGGLYARALSADATTAALAGDYLRWFVPALALQFAMVAMAAALRGSGNFKPGMVVQTATVILNMLLAPVLIFGWFTGRPLGVAGAALASFIAISMGTGWLLLYFLPSEASLRFVPVDWKPQLRLWGSMLKIGLPAGAEFALMGVYLFIVYSISRPFGSAAQAGFGIGLRIVQAGFMPVVALGFAVAPVAGQNFGARQPDRVRAAFRSALLLSVCVMLPLTLIAHIAPAAMIRFFSKDAHVVAVGDQYLQIISWNFVASGIIFVSSSMFQALGNTLPSLISSTFRIVIVAVPAYLLSRAPGFELRWIWYLSVVAVALQMILSLALLQREFRLRMDFAPIPAGLPDERGNDLLGAPEIG